MVEKVEGLKACLAAPSRQVFFVVDGLAPSNGLKGLMIENKL